VFFLFHRRRQLILIINLRMIVVIPLAIILFMCWARTTEILLHGMTDFGVDSLAIIVTVVSLMFLWTLSPTATIYR